MEDVWKLCDTVRGIAYAMHVYLGPGHLEKVYENGMANRLRKAGISVVQQHPIKVRDEDGTTIGDYFADLFVGGVLIVEIKSARDLAVGHEAQLLGYLRATSIEHGLLINFGAFRFQIRKYVRSSPRSAMDASRLL